MTRWGLVAASLRHHWRTSAGVLLGCAVASAVLVGALAVGDSVRLSLRQAALERIGRVDVALMAGERFFRAALADELQSALDGARVAPLVQLRGVASSPQGDARASGVNVLGVDERFFETGWRPYEGAPPGPGEVLLNTRLAQQLGATIGDEILLRVQDPSGLPGEIVLAKADGLSVGARARVSGIVPDDRTGRFGLQAHQLPPFNAFVSLPWLQKELEVEGRANMLLAWRDGGAQPAGAANEALRRCFRIEDAQLHVAACGAFDELVSERVFLDDAVIESAADLDEPAVGVLTYFVNELRLGERRTPYSTVCAAAPLDGDDANPAWAAQGWPAIIPLDLAKDQIVISAWLADDLGAAVGDQLDLTYFVPAAGRALEERTSRFRVRAVVPMEGPAADRTLMPQIPGLSDADHCRDWEPGIPIDDERIRDKDEQYWEEWRGTPKAFIGLAAGEAMWHNRFGRLTAIRFEPARPEATRADLARALDPARVGLSFQDVRAAALASGTSSTDFGGLFAGLSTFLVAAALLLTALLFVFGAEQRAAQIGTLLAVGWRPRQVRRLLLAEGTLLAAGGAVLGAAAGAGYTRLVLLGLDTIWRDAAGSASLHLHVRPVTLLFGAALSLIAAVAAMWIALRALVRRPVIELLWRRGGLPAPSAGGRRREAFFGAVAIVCAAAALVIALAARRGGASSAAAAFFGAGTLLLVAALAACRALLGRLDRPADPTRLSVARLGSRGSARRRGRSLATVALLACGTFLVVSVGANRLEAPADAAARTSGTGGFALVAQSTLPLLHELGSPQARDAYGLSPQEMEGVDVVSARVRDGDDASCLNIARVERPRLLGIPSSALAERGAFSFARVQGDADGPSPWLLLSRPDEPDVVPAIGDQATVTWSLHKGVGDTIDYVDERGMTFRVKIVATLAGSILQGDLIIDRAAFEERFPGESGFRVFLIDAPAARAERVAQHLSRALRDDGLEVVPAARRLTELNAVQNTYLAIFQLLGGLGLLLGSAGLGMVVLRNVLERRAELALLRAVGFPQRLVRRMIVTEHALLLALGVACGAGGALLAVTPALGASPGASPFTAAALLVLAVALSGLLWVWLASRLALRGPLLDALRSE